MAAVRRVRDTAYWAPYPYGTPITAAVRAEVRARRAAEKGGAPAPKNPAKRAPAKTGRTPERQADLDQIAARPRPAPVPDGAKTARLSGAQARVAARVFPLTGAEGRDRGASVTRGRLDVTDPAKAARRLDTYMHMKRDELDPLDRLSLDAVRRRLTELGAPDARRDRDAVAPDGSSPQPVVPTSTGPLPVVDEAAVDRVTTEVRDRAAKLLDDIGGPAMLGMVGYAAQVRDGITDSLRNAYPDMNQRSLELARDAVLRDVVTSASGQASAPGRGSRRAIRALARADALARDGRPLTDQVEQARAALGDPARFGRKPGSYALDIDYRDNGVGEHARAQLDAVRDAGAAITREVARRLEGRVTPDTPKNLRGRIEAQTRREVLAEVRPMGPGEGSVELRYAADMPGEIRARLRPMLDQAQRSLPTEWLQQGGDYMRRYGDGHIEVTAREGRGFFNTGTGRLEAGELNGGEGYLEGVMVHEMGHLMETAMLHIGRAEHMYLRDRIAQGEPGARTFDEQVQIKAPSAIAPNGEHAYRDDFVDAYTGKPYQDGPGMHELLTTGVESLFAVGYRDYSDPDFEQFTLGMMAVL